MKGLVSQLLSTTVDQDRTGDFRGSTDAEFEAMIPTLKNIFRTGRQRSFAEELGKFARAKQEEIERLCSYNYQARSDAIRREFVQAVDQMLRVRQTAADLKNRVVRLNEERQASGQRLLNKKRELLKQRKVLENLETTMDGVNTCLEVLRLSNRMYTQVEAKKYYSALKLLEDLETNYLPDVIHYEWAKHMKESFPALRSKVMADVDGQMKTWLFQIREMHRKVGKLAMDATLARQKSKFENLRRRAGSVISLGRAQLAQMSLSVELALNEENDFNVVDNDQLKVDFIPLYQAHHIYTTLGRDDEFKKQYDENRKAQLNLVLTGAFHLASRAQIGTFATYLQDIVGFFVIESVVCDTTENLRTRAAAETLWDIAVEKILKIVGDSLLNCYDPEIFLEIKVLVVVFIHTMETYDYPVTRLYELLLSLFNRYSDLLRLTAGEKVQKILDDDDYTPMTVRSQDEFHGVQKAFNIEEDMETAAKGFPRTLPFSRGFPQTCTTIKRFITGFYKFTEGFSQQYGEMDDIFKKALEALLSRNVNGALLQRLKGNNLTQVVQIVTNLTYYELACGEFERLVQEQRAAYRSGKVTLHAVQTFRDTHKTAEKRIFQIINDKLDNFMELVDYDFVAPYAAQRPSAWLQDMVGWLSTTISSTLSALPAGMKSFVYFDIFDHLNNNFKKILLDPNIFQITPAFVETLNADVSYVEGFLATLGDANVVECFAEVRQLINLAQSEKPEDFATPQGRSKSYPRVRVTDAISLFEKLQPPDSGMFKRKDAQQEQKRRNLDQLLERLRREVAGDSPTKDAGSRMSSIFTRVTNR
ncbi:exocyst complex subunit Sec15-like-domain-containing protein [Hyaloraphidium curvatum]|nr:exocyst complex subunit Sec15-like-domain-containing protein [Hyaloraphidium curvatum]